LGTIQKRKYERISQNFSVKLSKQGQDECFIGTIVNLSQGGALIKTKTNGSFRIQDRVTATFLLPPHFSGQVDTIGLQGVGVISRFCGESQRVAVKFDKSFRQFKRVDMSHG